MFRGFCFLFSPLLLPLIAPLGLLLWALNQGQRKQASSSVEVKGVLMAQVPVPDSMAQPEPASVA